MHCYLLRLLHTCCVKSYDLVCFAKLRVGSSLGGICAILFRGFWEDRVLPVALEVLRVGRSSVGPLCNCDVSILKFVFPKPCVTSREIKRKKVETHHPWLTQHIPQFFPHIQCQHKGLTIQKRYQRGRDTNKKTPTFVYMRPIGNANTPQRLVSGISPARQYHVSVQYISISTSNVLRKENKSPMAKIVQKVPV